jgi:phosphoglucomutase
MENFRKNPPASLGGSVLVAIKDYESLEETNLLTGEKKTIKQKTTSDVLQFFTEAGTKVSVRPSGTEPKIKFYFEVRGKLESREGYDAAELRADNLIDSMMEEMGLA